MTKLIKISALVSFILIICGMLFKTQHWPGADILFIAGTGSGVLSAFFLISSFVGKISSGLEKVNIIIASIAFALAMLAFVFKVMHWPGAEKIVWGADIGIALSAILFLIDGIMEKDAVKSGLKLISMFFLLFLLMLIVLLS